MQHVLMVTIFFIMIGRKLYDHLKIALLLFRDIKNLHSVRKVIGHTISIFKYSSVFDGTCVCAYKYLYFSTHNSPLRLFNLFCQLGRRLLWQSQL